MEHGLGYFNKTGLFKDMFQSLLAVLYGIIGNKVDELLDANIVRTFVNNIIIVVTMMSIPVSMLNYKRQM